MQLSDLTKRIIVAIIGAPIILHVVYWGGLQYFIFVLGILIISLWEFYTVAKFKAIAPQTIFGMIFVSVTQFAIYYYPTNYDLYFISLVIFIVAILTNELFKNNGSAYFNLGTTIIGAIMISIFGISLLLIRNHLNFETGGIAMIGIIVSFWSCDTFAFIVGSKFGKHKLFPRVSPNKTWEGAISGFVASVVTIYLFKNYFYQFNNLYFILSLGIIIGIFGQIGDLIESLFKRDAGIKDSSSFVPGHGGVWDRFDSLFFAAPIILILFIIFKIIS